MASAVILGGSFQTKCRMTRLPYATLALAASILYAKLRGR
jgi:hypothetical protein